MHTYWWSRLTWQLEVWTQNSRNDWRKVVIIRRELKKEAIKIEPEGRQENIWSTLGMKWGKCMVSSKRSRRESMTKKAEEVIKARKKWIYSERKRTWQRQGQSTNISYRTFLIYCVQRTTLVTTRPSRISELPCLAGHVAAHVHASLSARFIFTQITIFTKVIFVTTRWAAPRPDKLVWIHWPQYH